MENRFIFYYSLNIMECKDNSDNDSVWLLLELSVYILINDVCLETSDFVLKQIRFNVENPMDRGTWWAIVNRVAKSWTCLKWVSTHTYDISDIQIHYPPILSWLIQVMMIKVHGLIVGSVGRSEPLESGCLDIFMSQQWYSLFTYYDLWLYSPFHQIFISGISPNHHPQNTCSTCKLWRLRF